MGSGLCVRSVAPPLVGDKLTCKECMSLMRRGAKVDLKGRSWFFHRVPAGAAGVDTCNNPKSSASLADIVATTNNFHELTSHKGDIILAIAVVLFVGFEWPIEVCGEGVEV